MATHTYAELQDEIATLQAQAARLRNEEVVGVVARIKEAISVYGLTHKDLFGSKSVAVKAKAIRSQAAKYSDGKGGEWVGRGPRPQWLRSALAAGRKLEDFVVGPMKSGANAPAAPAAAPAAAEESAPANRGKKVKAAKKRVSKAKYGDGAGNIWSGFGPKPRWLKEAIAGGKKIEDLVV